MNNNQKTIKFRLWDGTRPVVLNGTTDARYTETFKINMDAYNEYLEKFEYGKFSTTEEAVKHIIQKVVSWRFNGECPYTVEIISIEPLETYPVNKTKRG